MYKHNDLTGKVFGRLTVLGEAGRAKDRRILWRCKCSCGNETVVSGGGLTSGKTQSCGCYKLQRISESRRKHGASGNHKNVDRLYKVWITIRKRCLTETSKDYKYYGGRGITICEEWNDFANFREWALQNGYSYDAKFGECTIDRIDVNGNYEPSNCRFVNMKVQAANMRNSKTAKDGE